MEKLGPDSERRFILRLAAQLGYANPDAMLREMSSNQLFEWIAYYQMEPFGVASLDYLFAHFKALFVNSNLKKGKHPYKPERFLIFGEKKKGGETAPNELDEE